MFLAKQDEQELREMKKMFDDCYFNKNPVITDAQYDIFTDFLAHKGILSHAIGADVEKKDRVKLPYHMGSINKITADGQPKLELWAKKNNCKTLVVTEKLDGVSGLLEHKNNATKLYTRGNGVEGTDISHLVGFLKGIPPLKEDFVVRGEIIMRKNIFEDKYSKKYKNARNMVSGIVGSKNIKKESKDLEFVVYEIVSNGGMPRPRVQLEKLRVRGFRCAMTTSISYEKLTIEKLKRIHANFKSASPYEIDGIVIQSDTPYDRNISGNPKYAFAFKVRDALTIKQTKVIDIEWSITAWKQLIPIAILEPVRLPGVTISRVSLSNAANMQEKGIGPGSLVEVTRSNDVIPYIVSVLRPADLKWPSLEYVWDDNRVHLQTNDAGVDQVSNSRHIADFFKKMSIKHVGFQTVKKLYDNGYDTIVKIVSASREELLSIDGFKDKTVDRILKNIKNGLMGVKMQDLLGAAGVFGRGMGKKRVVALFTDIPDILELSDGIVERVKKIEGYSEKSATQIANNLDAAKAFAKSIRPYIVLSDSRRVDNSFVGRKVVFSGFRDKEMESAIHSRGGVVTGSVSKNTYCLVVKVKGATSGKVKKAEQYGVPIYVKSEFQKMIK